MRNVEADDGGGAVELAAESAAGDSCRVSATSGPCRRGQRGLRQAAGSG